ncbi:MAG: hypothetical protein MPN21_21860 [Thermoanaerobaculia bacterium]|nr:hypothetical protein [Thermoanaerobaculia bacterium]
MYRRLRRLPLLLTVVLLAVPATAQNLVPNPTFDVNSDSWESPDISIVVDHTSDDGFTSPGAGLALGMVDASPFDPRTGLVQCVDSHIGVNGPLLVGAAGKAFNYTPGDFRDGPRISDSLLRWTQTP